MPMLRRAMPDDADAIARVHMRAWQVAYRGLMPDDFLEQLDVGARAERWRRNLSSPEGETYVAALAAAGAIVGFCSLLPARDEDLSETTGTIAALYIEPSEWRAGLGRALMSIATARARERGFSELSLWVLEGNHNARRFYESLGFASDGSTKSEDYGGATLGALRYRAPLVLPS